MIDLRSRQGVSPRPTRFCVQTRQWSRDDGLEDTMSIGALGGARLPRNYILCTQPCLIIHYFQSRRREIEMLMASVLLHTSGQTVFFGQTPGQRPPHITDLRVNTVDLGWVASPNKRATFRFHGAVISFVDLKSVDLSESRLFEFNIRAGLSTASIDGRTRQESRFAD